MNRTALTFLLVGKRLPRENLLVYLTRPNSNQYPAGDGTFTWGYVLPPELFAVVGDGLFFEPDGTPRVARASEIAANVATGWPHVLFKMISREQQVCRLAIYAPGVAPDTLGKARRQLHLLPNTPLTLDGRALSLSGNHIIIT